MSCDHCVGCLLNRIATAIESLVKEVAGLKVVLSRPGSMRMALVSEGENGMLTFVITLPPVGASDVVRRELNVTIANEEMQQLLPGIGDTQSVELTGLDNDAIHAELTDIDDAGNRSEPSVLDAVLLDTLEPPRPGQLGVKVVGEE